jgi:raffinose/stachyose/melibiose transport system substrate-binding protein
MKKRFYSLLRIIGVGIVFSLVVFGMLVSCQPQKVTFKVWWYEEDNAMGKSWRWALDELKKKNPNVEIKFELKTFEQIMESANMVLNSKDVPDLLETNKGNATCGVLVKNGLLSSLDAVAKQRKWLDIVGPSFQTTCRYNKDGLIGDNSSELMAITTYGEFVMVYYNKDIFKKYSIQVPTTLEEFEKVCDTLVSKKVLPIAAGGADKWPVTQNLYELALYKADRKFISDFQFLQDDIDFQGPVFGFAADKLKDWVKKGYYDSKASGTSYEDSNSLFYKQKAAMDLTGSWQFSGVAKNAKDFDWGIFLLPGKKFNTGSGGNVFVVPKNAVNKKIAYDFIDIALSPAAQTEMAKAGGIPVGKVDMAAITDEKTKQLNALFNQIKENDGLAFYPDWPIPDGWSIFGGAIQELMSGKKTPAETLKYMSDEYFKYKKTIKK